MDKFEQKAHEYCKSIAPLVDGQDVFYGVGDVERHLSVFAGKVVAEFVELARLGAVLQDNPEREKVLTQFANLMQSFLPKSPVPEEK